MGVEIEPQHGPLYVARRAGEAGPDDPGAARPCTRCGEDVWIDEQLLALAESCARVVCCECTGTAHGIVLIPSRT
jgi:hypothetical protein